MENLTFNIHDIMIFLGLIAAIWAFYKMVKEISEPRKALEKQVNTLETWHKEDHKRIKETFLLNMKLRAMELRISNQLKQT